MAENVAIQKVSLSRGKSYFTISVTFKNTLKRTCYVYSRVRSFAWDASRGELKLQLSDSALHDTPFDNTKLCLPNFEPLEKEAETKVNFFFQNCFTRVAPDSKALKIEKVDMTNIKRLSLEVDWSDTPFYFNPSEGRIGPQLKRWVKGKATAKADIKDKKNG